MLGGLSVVLCWIAGLFVYGPEGLARESGLLTLPLVEQDNNACGQQLQAVLSYTEEHTR